MKNFIVKNVKIIKVLLGILGLVLTTITLKHNLHLVDNFLGTDKFKLLLTPKTFGLLGVISAQNKKTIHIFEKYFHTFSWINLVLFIILVLTYNFLNEYPAIENIGIETYLEICCLVLEKKIKNILE